MTCRCSQCNPPDVMKNGMLTESVSGGKFRQRRGEEFCQGAQNPADRPADLQRILSRLVRHLGPAASHGQTGKLSAQLEAHARHGRVVQHLHGARRHDVRAVVRLRPAVQAGHVQLRLRRAHQRSRLGHAEIFPDARAVRQISFARRKTAGTARAKSGRHLLRRWN